jgi:hypothetical protein
MMPDREGAPRVADVVRSLMAQAYPKDDARTLDRASQNALARISALRDRDARYRVKGPAEWLLEETAARGAEIDTRPGAEPAQADGRRLPWPAPEEGDVHLRPDAEIMLFALMALSPRQFRLQVDEEIVCRPEGISRTTRVRQRVPQIWVDRVARAGEPGRVALPVVLGPQPGGPARPGELRTPADGIALLPEAETASIKLAVFRRLVALVWNGDPPSRATKLMDLLEKMMIRGSGAAEASAIATRLRAMAPPAGTEAGAMLTLATDFAVMAASFRLAVALFPVTEDGEHTFEYSSELPPPAAVMARRAGAKALLGAGPETFTYRPWLASTAPEYVLRVGWQPRSYLARQVTDSRGDRGRLTQSAGAPTAGFEARCPEEAGPPEPPPTVAFTFRRVPTPAAALVLFLALVAPLLAWLAGHAGSSSELLTGAAAAGMVVAYGRAVRARIDVLGLLSLAAALVFTVAALVLATTVVSASAAWPVLIILAAANALAALLWWIQRAAGYLGAIRQAPSPESADVELS